VLVNVFLVGLIEISRGTEWFTSQPSPRQEILVRAWCLSDECESSTLDIGIRCTVRTSLRCVCALIWLPARGELSSDVA